MTNSETKLKRQEYLQKVLQQYTKTEPALSLKEICEVLVWDLGDFSELLKAVKREVKKET